MLVYHSNYCTFSSKPISVSENLIAGVTLVKVVFARYVSVVDLITVTCLSNDTVPYGITRDPFGPPKSTLSIFRVVPVKPGMSKSGPILSPMMDHDGIHFVTIAVNF